jgi:hypothetical protein
VKFLPVVLLPLYWKRVRIRDAVLAAVIVGLLYVPFLNHGRVPIGSLGTYVQTFRFNGPVFAAFDRVVPPQLLVAMAVLVGLATATWLRIAAPDWSPNGLSVSRQRVLPDTERNHASQGALPTGDTEFHRGDATVIAVCNSVSPAVQASAFAWPMAASLLCAPAVFPWYLLWLLPFLTSASTLLIIVWTVSLMLTYVQWHLRALGRPWGPLPGRVMLLEYGCVAAAGAMVALRRLLRPASPR